MLHVGTVMPLLKGDDLMGNVLVNRQGAVAESVERRPHVLEILFVILTTFVLISGWVAIHEKLALYCWPTGRLIMLPTFYHNDKRPKSI